VGIYVQLAAMFRGCLVAAVGLLHSPFCFVAIAGGRLQTIGGIVASAATAACFVYLWYLVGQR
jgi:hypothetical protein